MLRSIGKQYGESAETVRKIMKMIMLMMTMMMTMVKKKAAVGRIWYSGLLGCIHDTVVSVSPGLKSTYDGLATTPLCMTPT